MSQELPPDLSSTSTLGATRRSPDAAADDFLVLPAGTPIGRYLILDHLGAGGMGTVHSAWDRELQRKIALKLVRPERKADEGAAQARSRFLREAQALAQINHPGVVAVHDVGPFGDEVFLAMEFVEGRDLRAYLDELPPCADRRRWPRVLEVFGEIAGGLMAVHAAGLVHRDVKPANVMVGKDGRARLMDFGLARRSAEPGEAAPAEAASPAGAAGDTGGDTAGDTAVSPLDARLSRTGLRIGTPSYMSPEQYLGQPCDARSDVFSFSVALYEALYGRRPFGEGADFPARLASGEVAPRPAGTPVPEELHRALLRGLARDPGERWPGIAELVAALAAVPARRRRRQLLAAAAAGLLALGLLAYGLRRYQDGFCGAGDGALAAVFGAPQKAAIGQAFAATGKSFATATARGLTAQLEDWGRSWAAQRRDACEATHRRGEQSEELLDRRMFCLDRRLAELRSAVGLLVAADLALAENPRPALDLLGDLELCADRVQLASGGKLPPAGQREETRRIQQRLIDARARAAQGPGDESRQLAATAIGEAERLGYAPLLAEARLTLCRMDIENSRSDDAYAGCTASAAAAIAADDADGLANAAAHLAWLTSEVLGKPRDAVGWMAIADAAAGRLGQRALLASSLAHTRGMIAARLDDDERALATLRESLALAAAAPGTDLLQSALQDDLGTVLSQLGRFGEAEEAYRRALELGQRVFGPDHPTLASTLNNLGSLHWSQQHYEDALLLHRAAVELLRKAYGGEHRLVALSLNNVATVLRDLARHEEADRNLLEAIAILERVLGPEHSDLATALGNLAYGYRLGGQLEKALPLYLRAHRILEKNLGESSFAVANSHQSLGVTLTRLERFPEALLHLEKAVAIYHAMPTDPRSRGTASFVLARTLRRAGREPDRSRRLAREALRDFETDPGRMAREIELATAWLAERP